MGAQIRSSNVINHCPRRCEDFEKVSDFIAMNANLNGPLWHEKTWKAFDFVSHIKQIKRKPPTNHPTSDIELIKLRAHYSWKLSSLSNTIYVKHYYTLEPSENSVTRE